jgi:hypothetical protein
MSITVERQVEIMEAQLQTFDNLFDKLQYMRTFFDNDPEFTQDARDVVRGNICKLL